MRRQLPYKARSSRAGGKRGCICPNGTYSSKCCDGSLWAQGIGALSNQGASDISIIHKSFNNDFDKSFAI
jgi:hypothetical protein